MPRVENRIGLLRLDPVNPAVTRMKRAPPGHPWSPPRTGGAFAHSIPEPPRSRKPRRTGTRLGGAEAAEVGGAGPISSAGGTPATPPRGPGRRGTTSKARHALLLYFFEYVN